MPRWVPLAVVHDIHQDQLAENGGSPGVRDPGGLESALARPLHLQSYGAAPDLCDLAACYAYGLATTQHFVDGNKRTAFMTAYAFLKMNGLRLVASQGEAYNVVMGVAVNKIGESELAEWFRQNTEPLPED